MNDQATIPVPPLADRIRAALTEEMASADISTVIDAVAAETEALAACAADAEQATLDPLASTDDIAKARATAAEAEFELKRLAVAEERLAKRLSEAQDAEKHAAADAQYDAALKERDALAADLAKQYPKAAQTIADLLARIVASDAAIKKANDVRGRDREPLMPAEIVARGQFRPGIQALGTIVNLPRLEVEGFGSPYWGPRW